MRLTRKWIIGSACAVVGVTGVGIGVAAATGHGPTVDPQPERDAEAAYTNAHRGQAAVSDQEAVAAALARHHGNVLEVHLENEGDGLRWEVKPDDGQQVWEVQVDADTGAVVGDQPDD
jgi:uncharacterized membrane protein YkoI